ncbi:MAG: hypothetical protein ACU85V_00110 [Gammaproteobacteria bacterium]
MTKATKLVQDGVSADGMPRYRVGSVDLPRRKEGERDLVAFGELWPAGLRPGMRCTLTRTGEEVVLRPGLMVELEPGESIADAVVPIEVREQSNPISEARAAISGRVAAGESFDSEAADLASAIEERDALVEQVGIAARSVRRAQEAVEDLFNAAGVWPEQACASLADHDLSRALESLGRMRTSLQAHTDPSPRPDQGATAAGAAAGEALPLSWPEGAGEGQDGA